MYYHALTEATDTHGVTESDFSESEGLVLTSATAGNRSIAHCGRLPDQRQRRPGNKGREDAHKGLCYGGSTNAMAEIETKP